MKNKKYFTFSIISNNKLVGLIIFRIEKDKAHISWLVVDKKYRGKGLGRKLLEKVVNFCKIIKINRITICTWSSNKIALNLYKKVGFKVFKILKNHRGIGIDTICLEKNPINILL